jgi:putative tricarboxylic transport membrane protein
MRMTKDRWAGVFFFSAAALIAVESLRLSIDDIHNPGPGFMPFVVGLALAFLSVLCFLLGGKEEKAGEPSEKGGHGRKVIFLISAGLVIYLPAMRLTGFYAGTFLLLVCLMKLSGEKGYRRAVAVSLATMGITYILFERLLYIPFPKGLLGI